MEKYRNDGTLEERLKRAEELGNDKMDPWLLKKADAKIRRKMGLPVPSLKPPPAWEGMPTAGTVKVPVFCVEFPDYPHVIDVPEIENQLFGEGDPSEYPYESLTNFYERSSYGALHIQGDVFGWYNSPNPRSFYTWENNKDLIEEIVNHFDGEGVDFSQYDNDGDGAIDLFIVIWSGPHTGWSSYWWGSQRGYYDSSFTVDGKTLSNYTWNWETYWSQGGSPGDDFDQLLHIHETGHALGLPDYYDYNSDVGPRGGVGGLDMMHGNWGDHNSFSKFVLEWLDPTVIAAPTSNVQLQSLDSSAQAIVLAKTPNPELPFNEYFIIDNRNQSGNDSEHPGSGLLIWHIDATLNSSGSDYVYNNHYTDHKLIRLMEADGLEEIELGRSADEGDYWSSDAAFGPFSTPNSNYYDGSLLDLSVVNISPPGATVTFNVIQNDPTPPEQIAQVNDGKAEDLDEQGYLSNLFANWTPSVDPDSGLIAYWISAGTIPGASDTVEWTSVGKETSAHLSGLNLTDGQTYYVSVKAQNGVGLFGDAAVTDGIAIDRSLVSGLLLVDDDEGNDYEVYYADSLTAVGEGFDVWETGADGELDGSIASEYETIVWNAGFDAPSSNERSALSAFLDGGGRLFISGQDIGFYIGSTSFYQNYLSAEFVNDNSESTAVAGVEGDPIAGGLTLQLAGGDGANNQQWPSEIDPIAPANAIFHYEGGFPLSSGAAAIKVDALDYKLVYFAFGFEGIDGAADRDATMLAVLNWLKGENIPPTLSWTGEDGYLQDGLEPEEGDSNRTYVFKVRYRDADGNAPADGFPKIHLLKSGVEIPGSPFSTTFESGEHFGGSIFKYETTLEEGAYSYYFEAPDARMAAASGDPTSPTSGPSVQEADLSSIWTSPETESTESAAAADFNGDGLLDFAAANGTARLRVYESAGQNSFDSVWSTRPSSGSFQDVAWGDFDNDGDLDLGVATGNGQNRVYENDGLSDFSLAWKSSRTEDTTAFRWGDADNDGDLDFAVGNAGQPTRVFINYDGGQFIEAWASPDSYDTLDVAWADADRDGDLDLAVANGSNQPDVLYENLGGNAFEAAWTSPEMETSRSVAWGDYDGDGAPDLLFGGEGAGSRIYRNLGGLAFASAWASSAGDDVSRAAWGDYDGDGDFDFAMASGVAATTVVQNQNGQFETAYELLDGESSNAAVWGDFDGDGDLDFLSGNGGQQGIRLYRNNLNAGGSAPSAPTLIAEPDGSGSSATLQWTPGSDGETTDSDLLTYDARIGLTSQGCEVFCGFFPKTGMGWGSGAAGATTSFTLNPIEEGTYYWSVRTVDTTFRRSGWSAEDSFAFNYQDDSPPGPIETVNDGWGDDVDHQFHTDRIFANWSESLDEGSGIAGYWASVGTSAGASDAVPWTKYDGVSVEFSGLALASLQTYYVTVKAENGAGSIGPAATSDGVTVDDSPPSGATDLNDGVGADIDATAISTRITANWTAAEDGDSGVAAYWFCIGTTAGASDALPWKEIEPATGHTEIGLELAEGQTYYVSVAAQNGAGAIGPLASTDGVLVDSSLSSPILLVDDDGGSYDHISYTSALLGLERDYDYWDVNQSGAPTMETTSNYSIVIWHTGQGTLSESERQTLAAYLDSGGLLFLSGSNLGATIGETGFYSDYLHASFVKNNVGSWLLEGAPEHYIAPYVQFGLLQSTLESEVQSSEIDPIYPARTSISYVGGSTSSSGSAAVSVAREAYRAVYMAVGYEDLYGVGYTGTKTYLMGQILSWLEATPPHLEWTGAAGYEADGVSPDEGYSKTPFVFKVNYFDPEDSYPDSDNPKVHILQDGVDIDGGPFAMKYKSGSYTTGAVFQYTTELPSDDNYSYYFEGKNFRLLDTIGIPTEEVAGPFLSADYTPPSSIAVVNDGLSDDADLTSEAGSLSANWTASADAESGVTAYWYAVGTAGNDSAVLDWTSAGTNLSVTAPGLSLNDGQTYYFSIRAENGDGDLSQTTKSDGATLVLSSDSILLEQGWNQVGVSRQNVQFDSGAVFGLSAGQVVSLDANGGYEYLTSTGTVALEPGKGYWIYAGTDLGEVSVSGSPIDGSFETDEWPDGWMMFSLPYATPIVWNGPSVRLNCGGQDQTLPSIYTWDPELEAYQTLEPTADVYLKPWTGYWLRAPFGKNACKIAFSK